ncbi:MAG: DUF493 domain-containing protein [bacterium]|nr:DUF493 domain-containing protein [bacterium]
MKKEILDFPQEFTLKIIVENVLTDNENKSNIKTVLESENINGTDWSSKLSKEGKYLSYRVRVNISDKDQMDSLYAKIKSIPYIKYAI